MFCSKCGAQMPDGSAFCEKCGAPLGTAQQSAQPTSPQQQYQQTTQQQWPQTSPQKSKKGLILKIAVAAVLVLAVVAASPFILNAISSPKGLNGAELAPQRLYEDEQVTVDITGFSYDKSEYNPYQIGLKITNHTDHTIVVNCADLVICVNGDQFPTCVGSGKVMPGETVSDRSFAFQDYGKGYGKIKTLSFSLEIGTVGSDGKVTERYDAGDFTLKTNLA